MVSIAKNQSDSYPGEELRRVSELLGGRKVFPNSPSDALEVHEMLLQGLPLVALHHLIDNLMVIGKRTVLERAVGMSLRTFHRRMNAPSKPLNQEESGRTWKFAVILSQATAIFGSQAEAEHWMEHPATGLNQLRPIDLLATAVGAEIIKRCLERLEYGVYA